ncbi:hypothetical protein B0H17DRAFT_1256237 [Mycena rosella]|uniref:Uncharacterized protein n=1 Tax=Mycena rosella TaxID=1033263 RepID=A0AAD7CV87_MYCRO|nr:hypothetical protein B0H17DRAFT_1256237 [Mycena rosella]
MREVGTRIGDVGILTENGAFDPIFNILHRSDDPINRFGVPQGFEPVLLAVMISGFLPAGLGAVVEVQQIRRRRRSFCYQTVPQAGTCAAASIPDYASKHGQSWYDFVNGGSPHDQSGACICNRRHQVDVLDVALEVQAPVCMGVGEHQPSVLPVLTVTWGGILEGQPDLIPSRLQCLAGFDAAEALSEGALNRQFQMVRHHVKRQLRAIFLITR